MGSRREVSIEWGMEARVAEKLFEALQPPERARFPYLLCWRFVSYIEGLLKSICISNGNRSIQ